MNKQIIKLWLRATSLPTEALLVLIRAYKTFISPLFTGSCRFVPSCSSYAEEAVMRYGILRGGYLAIWRLARCHPFCVGGLDTVPSEDLSRKAS